MYNYYVVAADGRGQGVKVLTQDEEEFRGKGGIVVEGNAHTRLKPE